jgi:hypothetical protein
MVLQNFIIYLILISSISFASLLINRLIYKKNQIFNMIFFILIPVLIGLIAVYFTHFSSVYSILLFVFLIFLIFFREQINLEILNSHKLNRFNCSFLLLASPIFFIFHNYGFYLLADHIYYAKLSNALIKYGVENPYSLYFDYIGEQGLFLYHYLDLWINGFIVKIFNVKSVFSLVNIVYPFFSYVTFLTVFFIIYKGNNFFDKFFLSLIISFGSIILFIQIIPSDEGHETFWNYGFPHVTSFKSLCLYPFILLGLNSFKKKQYSLFLLFSLISIISYITVIPSFLFSINIILIFLFIIYKEERIIFIYNFFFFNISILLIFIIFIFLNNQTKSINGVRFIDIFYPISYYFKNFEYYIFKPIKLFLFLFLLNPLSLVISFLILKKFKFLFGLIYLILLSSAFLSVFLDNTNNSIQYFTTIIGPVTLFLLTQYFELKNNIFKVFLIFSVFFIFSFNINFLLLFKNTNYYRNSNFDSKIALFAKKYIRDENWLYYSKSPYSSWSYSTNIVKCPILQNEVSKMGVDIAPVFRKDFTKYNSRNLSYPFNRHYKNIKELIEHLISYEIKYIFVENIDSVDTNFKYILSPCLINEKKGIWKIRYFQSCLSVH